MYSFDSLASSFSMESHAPAKKLLAVALLIIGVVFALRQFCAKHFAAMSFGILPIVL